MPFNEKPINNQPEAGEHYHDRAVIHDIEISVGWDDGYKKYTIYFPQINFGEEMKKAGIRDQVIIINQRNDSAEVVFDFAKQAAERSKGIDDLFSVYKQTEDFIEEWGLKNYPDKPQS